MSENGRKPGCERACSLGRWLSGRGLGKRACGQWLTACTPNNYSRGNILFYQGNMPLGLYFVCQGRVKLVRGEGRGRQQIVRIVDGPAVLGERALVAQVPYAATAELAEDSRVCFSSANSFFRLWAEEPEISRLVARLLAERLGDTQQSLTDMGLHTVRERLAMIVVRRHEAAQGGPVDLGESRQELAQLLGTAPEVVCRALSELEDKGILAVDGRHAEVRDETRLRWVAQMPAKA